MALSANKSRLLRHAGDDIFNKSYVVGTSVTIYEGALVSLDANGRAVTGVNTKQALGVAMNYVAQGATIDTTKKVIVQTNQIERFTCPATTATAGFVGDVVLVVADNTLAFASTATFTKEFAVNRLGIVVDYDETGGYLWVKVDPLGA